MRELEIKILGINKNDLIKKIRSVGARLIAPLQLMKISYFDFPDHRIKNNHELLRVRELSPKNIEITYKCNKQIKNGCKIYQEIELPADDLSAIKTLFKKLGLKETLYYEKKRQEFKLGKTHLVIDEYPKNIIPPYLEIEAPNSQTIEKIIKLLELKKFKRSTETVNELFEKLKIKLNGLRFKK